MTVVVCDSDCEHSINHVCKLGEIEFKVRKNKIGITYQCYTYRSTKYLKSYNEN